MDGGDGKSIRFRELPPLPKRGQRALPTMSSQDTADFPAPKRKKKKPRKDANGEGDVDDQEMEMGGLGSRRASEVGDHLTLGATTDAPTQRKRKKKKAMSTDLEDNQADLVNGDTGDQTTDGEEVVKKTKKKKRSKVAESPLPDEFCVEEDDIINDSCSPIPQQALFSAPQGQSQPVGKLFVERTKRFQAAERSDWRTTGEQMDGAAELQHMPPLWTTRDVSVRVHEGFRVFGLFCHGFLAGYAVWNVVVVYMLAGQHLTALRNLLEQYHGLAYPSQSLLYMLLAICTVASFDRVNLAKGPVALRQIITLDPVALASFCKSTSIQRLLILVVSVCFNPTLCFVFSHTVYFSALILSLSQQMTSDRINLYASSNTTIWPQGSEHQILHPWVTINLVVALLVGLAWIFIATRPETDYTEGYLRAMEVEPARPEDKPEITG
ncbi:transmembrane protein 237B-like isoform X1 [Xiphophorus couchianus]|uniref:transmembrane protein 237B-like isoform X1 n=1 Tax=Xiphophorus couchianus TaxID=32473 RepID=UPI001016C1BF|nr:transmembrane protein 237B-like isoform X1 [Xiphophorus couchianus]